MEAHARGTEVPFIERATTRVDLIPAKASAASHGFMSNCFHSIRSSSPPPLFPLMTRADTLFTLVIGSRLSRSLFRWRPAFGDRQLRVEVEQHDDDARGLRQKRSTRGSAFSKSPQRETGELNSHCSITRRLNVCCQPPHSSHLWIVASSF
jgi:hypothetical protein